MQLFEKMSSRLPSRLHKSSFTSGKLRSFSLEALPYVKPTFKRSLSFPMLDLDSIQIDPDILNPGQIGLFELADEPYGEELILKRSRLNKTMD